jgi:monoamine oxidase
MYRLCMTLFAVFSLLTLPLGVGCDRSASSVRTVPAVPAPTKPGASPSPGRSEEPAEHGPPAPQEAAARVVVVGGGLAGLLAAYELQKRGLSAHVLEADAMWGGRVATAQYPGGVSAEYGMQELWQNNPLLQIARELGVPLDEHPQNPYSSVVIDGKLYPYFRGTKEAYFDTLMSRGEKKRFLAWLAEAQKLRALAEKEGITNPRIRELQALSFAAWVESAKLPRSATELVRLLIECELASGWHGFSALFGLLELGVFLDEGQLAHHVRGGNSHLIEALVRALRGPKTLSALVTRVERTHGAGGRLGVRVYYQKERRLHVVEAERVVIAVPFWRLHQIEMSPPLSDKKWQAIQSLARGQYTVVHLLMPKEARKLWMIGGKPPLALLTDGALGVVYGTFGEPPAAAPAEVFSMLIHGPAAASFHMVPRENKLRDLYAHLDRLWPGFSKQVQVSQVFTYHPAAIPVWPPGRSPLDELSHELRQPELGLHLAGDYLYNAHADGAARSGIRAAERIAEELGQPLKEASSTSSPSSRASSEMVSGARSRITLP